MLVQYLSYGGAMFVKGTATLTDCTFNGNTATVEIKKVY
jgi:hypothetical protein